MIELIIGGCTAYYAWKKKCAIDKYWNVESMTEAEKILEIMREASIIMEQNKPSWYTPMGKQEDNKQ